MNNNTNSIFSKHKKKIIVGSILVLLFLTNPNGSKLRTQLYDEGYTKFNKLDKINLGICSVHQAYIVGEKGLENRIYFGMLGSYFLIKEREIEGNDK